MAADALTAAVAAARTRARAAWVGALPAPLDTVKAGSAGVAERSEASAPDVAPACCPELGAGALAAAVEGAAAALGAAAPADGPDADAGGAAGADEGASAAAAGG
ncbi:MAG TPA: hypothetical protein VFB26_09650, partial [Gaiellaceae bacterium]|nr:hypothetical protein [Gaiellaceae bacterium]